MLDLLVIGGGPAGLATALHARRSGLTVAVVEARPAPIDKACGEGLMPPAVRALANLDVRPNGLPFRGICYRDSRRYPERCAVADFADGRGLAVRRTELHAALSQAVSRAGVDVVEGKVSEIDQTEAAVSASGLSARYLVAADGLHSTVRRSLGLDRPVAAARWGVRAHFACAPWSERVEVYWAPSAEAYVTPIGPDCVGVAVLGSERRPFAARLQAFPSLAERLPARSATAVRGAGPFRQRAAARTAGRVLLVGDSAGYVDALTGEGLSMAFACAQAAVRRIGEGRVDRYERDYRAITRRYRVITTTLLAAAEQPVLRRAIVPLAERVPWLFRAAVNQLAR
jgi:flavin-dependent dehydrogenase